MRMVKIGQDLWFYEEDATLAGVQRVAEYVKRDIELVTGCYPGSCTAPGTYANVVIYGTAGKSPVLEQLQQAGKLDLDRVRGKREVFLFQILENPLEGIESALVIVGSDKRGTIYGLFHLSEVLGVSPLVNWNHVWPMRQKTVDLTERENMVSREPSVKYRGFFINDEWPAFGTWANEHFGGINAKCYERVFELLLRLKGNYLWPAMWASDFNLDGPGLESARLADELGIVMSTSHHEPCMRSGGEYGKVRGKDSPYGDAWDFLKNPDGITKFWRDGLLRNREFENVITMGMRGENDTAIMAGATLEENIALLRSVIKTQNQLIRETIDSDLSKVPRQIVLFTEVEEFFYGNASTQGLMNDPELEGVTLMLSDNNHGFTRTLPSEEMRLHKGGYGMYYHMDMHGGAHSFQWIGSTYLPKLWEQMTMAYEYGVREIWVTNIGDIGTQELGLSFFLDLAYDMEKWGGTDAAITNTYTEKWIQTNFGQVFVAEDQQKMIQIVQDYTRLLARRKHEVMNEEVYHPVHFGEAEEVLHVSENILRVCGELKGRCPERWMAAFQSLIYYPACGTANLMKMWILAGRNQLYAHQNRMQANELADKILGCFQTDEVLTEEYHSVDQGYFYGFGASEHIGFTTWCDEDNKYPLRTYVYPANQPRMIISRVEDTEYSTGLFWSDKPQTWRDALRPDVDEILFDIACGSAKPVRYRIDSECEWMSFSSRGGEVQVNERVTLHIHRERFSGRVKETFSIVNLDGGKTEITVEADNTPVTAGRGVFLERDGYIAMEASHYFDKRDVMEGGYKILAPFGRTGSGIKVFPVTADFADKAERPCVRYLFETEREGIYRIQFYMAATTPVVYERRQFIGFSLNDEPIQIVNTVKEPDKQFFLSRQWSEEAYTNIKITEAVAECRKGLNQLFFWGMSPAIVLERIILCREELELPASYLGPRESYRVMK